MLLQTDIILQKALEYGLSFALMLIAITVMWRELIKERKYSKELVEKTIKLLTLVEGKIKDDSGVIEDVRDRQKEIMRMTQEILQMSKTK